MSRLNSGSMKSLLENKETVARLFTILSSPNRLEMLSVIADGEKMVGEISAAVNLSQSAVSQHLAKMRAAGIVSCRREAQRIYYKLTSNEVRNLLSVFFIASGYKSAQKSAQPRVAVLPAP
ncbi:ArsR/SmtB family transcription factor [Brucella intermedia]|uniref:ArsR/SmtB family transcription factor n=1 Tax=Brucella intermedia TaxID=94625 RepID=UPI0009B8A225|nr:metalloregulator ArsR/SmtB family transcription factor [Brucella intermedia]